MKVERRDGEDERRVVIGCVVSRAVLAPVAARWEPGLFPSRWASLVVGWCVDHYNKYSKPPGRDIEVYYDAWVRSGRDKDTAALVEMFLASLSDDYAKLKKSSSPEYVLDLAGKLFTRTKLTALKDAIEVDLEGGEIDQARDRVEGFRRIDIGSGAGVDFTTDEDAAVSSLSESLEPVITYPGAAGNFYGNALARDSFFAFLAPEKRGKSTFVQDMAWRAVEQGRKVAYFEVGDMSQNQVMRRLLARAAGTPALPCRYEFPLEMDTVGKRRREIPELKTAYRDAPGLSPEDAVALIRKTAKKYGPDALKLSCHPNSTITVPGIDAILDQWERDGFTADVIAIDYADILAPMSAKMDVRDQINTSWKAMKSMSQKRHCLVVTATQSDTDSYDAWLLDRSNFSEDKRKNAHVTGMIGINQTPAEKDRGVYRLNWVHRRDLEYSEGKCLWLAACMAIVNPCVLSTF